MNRQESAGGFKPFRNLKSLMGKRIGRPSAARQALPAQPASQQETPPSGSAAAGRAVDPEADRLLFEAAMADVTPIDRGNRISGNRSRPRRFHRHQRDPDRDVIVRLRQLVDCGRGFVVNQTPEYMEGTGHLIHPEMASRLHRGDFAIQDHIDLHGLTVSQAREHLDRFLKRSLIEGKQAVLIIHGRGLSSPSGPVLKAKVWEWLSRSAWRKWVIAFASARLVDGGAGATYVLLRGWRPGARNRRPPSLQHKA